MNINARFFPHFSCNHLFQIFTRFSVTSQKAPNAKIAALLKQNTSVDLLDDDSRSGNEKNLIPNYLTQFADIA